MLSKAGGAVCKSYISENRMTEIRVAQINLLLNVFCWFVSYLYLSHTAAEQEINQWITGSLFCVVGVALGMIFLSGRSKNEIKSNNLNDASEKEQSLVKIVLMLPIVFVLLAVLFSTSNNGLNEFGWTLTAMSGNIGYSISVLYRAKFD